MRSGAVRPGRTARPSTWTTRSVSKTRWRMSAWCCSSCRWWSPPSTRSWRRGRSGRCCSVSCCCTASPSSSRSAPARSGRFATSRSARPRYRRHPARPVAHGRRGQPVLDAVPVRAAGGGLSLGAARNVDDRRGGSAGPGRPGVGRPAPPGSTSPDLHIVALRVTYALIGGILIGYMAEIERIQRSEAWLVSRILGRMQPRAGLVAAVRAALDDLIGHFRATHAVLVFEDDASSRIVVVARRTPGRRVGPSGHPPEPGTAKDEDAVYSIPIPAAVDAFKVRRSKPDSPPGRANVAAFDKAGARLHESFSVAPLFRTPFEWRTVLCVAAPGGEGWTGTALPVHAVRPARTARAAWLSPRHRPAGGPRALQPLSRAAAGIARRRRRADAHFARTARRRDPIADRRRDAVGGRATPGCREGARPASRAVGEHPAAPRPGNPERPRPDAPAQAGRCRRQAARRTPRRHGRTLPPRHGHPGPPGVRRRRDRPHAARVPRGGRHGPGGPGKRAQALGRDERRHPPREARRETGSSSWTTTGAASTSRAT